MNSTTTLSLTLVDNIRLYVVGKKKLIKKYGQIILCVSDRYECLHDVRIGMIGNKTLSFSILYYRRAAAISMSINYTVIYIGIGLPTCMFKYV